MWPHLNCWWFKKQNSQNCTKLLGPFHILPVLEAHRIFKGLRISDKWLGDFFEHQIYKVQFEMLQWGFLAFYFRLLGGVGCGRKIQIQAVFHQNFSSKFILCVTLPGKWSLKTLMRAPKDMAVSEGKPLLCWKMSNQLIFDRSPHPFWKAVSSFWVAVSFTRDTFSLSSVFWARVHCCPSWQQCWIRACWSGLGEEWAHSITRNGAQLAKVVRVG